MIVGGDGYASHADCDPVDAAAELPTDDDACWICHRPLDLT